MRIGADVHALECTGLRPDGAQLVLDGIAQQLAFVRDGRELRFHVAGAQPHHVRDRSLEPLVRGTASNGDGRVRASMNGRVVAVLVEPGQNVTAGQAVLTLEAMKMEHVHSAASAGIVKAVHARAGDQVQAGRVVVELEAPAASA